MWLLAFDSSVPEPAPRGRRKWRRGAVIALRVYLGLLLASTLWLARSRARAPLPEGTFVAKLQAQTASGPISGQIEFAYRDSAPERRDLPVVVMIHGSPGTSKVMEKLAAALPPKKFRFLVPDLPGFGLSTHQLADYSFRAHARYLLALLNQLGIERAQFVGFSMGGGVELSLFDLAPQKVQSLVMLSALGVQEHEWLGTYAGNHRLHGLQLGLLWLIYHGTPHFGLLENEFFDGSFARNFYDSDQRPLRAVLQKYKGPMLIIHGRKDPLVPLAAAMEHRRLVPQSELLLFDSDHFMTFLQPELFASQLAAFLSRHAGQ